MTGLSDIEAVLQGWTLVCVLVGMGLGVGILTGLFGVGGGFLLTPLLNVLLGIDYQLAVGSDLACIVGTSASGLARHARLKNVEVKCMLILAGERRCAGAVLGDMLQDFLVYSLCGGNREHFKLIMHGLFIVLLLLTAWLVFRGPGRREGGPTPLQRLPLPPHVALPAAGLAGVSLPGLCLVGTGVGVLTGLMGVGGGVLFMPILLLAVGLAPHQAVGTSLGVVLFAAVAGTVKKGMGEGKVSLWIAMSLLMGSTIGVQIGAWICRKLHATRLRRFFALIVVAATVVIAVDFLRKLSGPGAD